MSGEHSELPIYYAYSNSQNDNVSRACVAENSIGENVMSVPQPIVTICNESDLYATVVRIQFGDVLGDLLDTVRTYVCM